ncbi:MAG TPA: AI-2E family transporter [Roseiflexaceae bacterium]|nr:AI-2E family transporter [Roseiflexaceae bacterium]
MSVEPKPIRLSPVGKFITIAIIVALAILLIRAVGPILTPFVAAVITAYLFNPLIGWLHRRTGIGRGLWIGVLYLLIGSLAYACVRSLGPMVASQYRGLVAQIPRMSEQVELWIAANQYVDIGGFTIDLYAFEKPITDFFHELSQSLPSRVPDLVVSALERVLLFVTYLIVTFYLLLQTEQITNGIYGLVPAPYRAEIRGLGGQIDAIFAGYIRGTLLLIPIMSVLTYIALSILQIRYALVIAIASGILEIIPVIGPWSAAGIAVMVSLLQPTTPFGWSHTVLAIVVGVTYLVLRMAEDYFVIPQVVGHAVNLHPVLVLFAILAGGALAGPFGLLIGIPVVAVAQLLLRYLYRKLVDAPEPPPPEIKEPPLSQPAPKPAEPPLVASTMRKRRS